MASARDSEGQGTSYQKTGARDLGVLGYTIELAFRVKSLGLRYN